MHGYFIHFVSPSKSLLTKQFFAAGFLVISLFTIIGTRGFFQVRALHSAIEKREKKAIRQLKKIFTPKHPALKKKKLATILREAEREIEERDEAWKPFMQENLQPLEILNDLTQTMDKRSFNIKIEKRVLWQNQIK